MAFYLPAIVIFYFCAAFAILAILRPTRFYRYSVVLVLLVSVTHVLGGLSWYFRVAWYSDGIMILSAGSIIFAFCLFGYSLIHQKRLSVNRPEWRSMAESDSIFSILIIVKYI